MKEKEETLNELEEQDEILDSSLDTEEKEEVSSFTEETEEVFIEDTERTENIENETIEEVVENIEKEEIENPIEIEENEEIEKKTTTNSHKTLFILSISLLILLLLFLLFSTVFALLNNANSTIIRGVSIQDVDVSGLTKEQALEKVSSIFGEKLEQTITLTHEDYAIDVFARTIWCYFCLGRISRYGLPKRKNAEIFSKTTMKFCLPYFLVLTSILAFRIVKKPWIR